MKFTRLITLLLVLMLALSAVGIVTAQGDLGSEDNPIQVFFVPSAEAQALLTRAQPLEAALKQATGLNFHADVPTSYATTIEAMCAAPASSMGFIPAAGYVIGNNRCGIEVGAAAVRRGWPVYWAQYLVRRDSDIYTFGDLEGRTWAYPDATSTSGRIFPLVELGAAGITTGEQVEAGGHGQAVQAVYNGEVDFATSFYSPPVMPEGHAPWGIGDLPEPYDLSAEESFVNEDGELYVGDIRILDARLFVASTSPDIVDQVRILRLSAPIPNDTLSFGPEFPEELRSQIIDALVAYSETDEWGETALGNAEEGYDWTSLAVVDDSLFNVIRQQFEILGLTEQDIFEEG